jgi:tetratricopeptide (TPR) repeat protein
VTRNKSKGIRKAARLYRKRQYTQVINLLEPQVFMFRESWAYYHLLGMSCMYTGDYAGAYSYLRRASDLDDTRSETRLGIGAVLLRRRQVDLAIRNYLDILDTDPRNRRARRALQWIRTLDNPDDVVEWFETGRISKVLPPKGAYVPVIVHIGIILLFLAAGALFLGPHAVRAVSGFFQQDDRPGSEVLALEERSDGLTEEEGSPRFLLSDRDVENLFREVGRLFNDNRDNMVRRELNRISLSNAAPSVKRQAELLRSYLTEPDFTTMADSFPYRDVSDDPELHDGVFVKWRGRIANLSIGEDAITFDLLAGYESGRVVEGIVPVRVPYAVLLNDGESVELIGRVSSGRDTFSLTVTSIRTLGPKEVERQ